MNCYVKVKAKVLDYKFLDFNFMSLISTESIWKHFFMNRHRPIVLQIRQNNMQARLQIAIPLAQRITLWCPPLPANFLKRELPGNSPRKR